MRFYVLDYEVGSSHETMFNAMAPNHIGKGTDRQACPACGEHMGMLPWLPPYRAEVKAYGKQLGDVAFGPGNGLLVSARFRAAWEATDLRGLEFAPIERIRVRPARFGKKPVTYWHVAPRRFGTRIDVSRGLIEWDTPHLCMTCLDANADSIRGFAIDETSWTGEDMFYAWGLNGSIIVTDRVRQLRDEHGLTNINLTPVEEFFWDPYYRWAVIDYSPADGAPALVPITDEPTDAN